MLKRLFSLPFKNPLARSTPAINHQILPRDEHNISRRQISRAALKVMQRLGDGGYEAYLVGGGVRDLLLKDQPKDFDVATDATPEQVKQLFRNARIIGRRFKIVHVRFGREIIEVTTFRGHHHDASSSKHSARSEDGMLLRDNVYGDIQSDAIRRDFTVNALYYTLNKFSVHDFTNGMRDIQERKIRMIGKPETRYQEDPVRMLRAVRFAAKLNFDIERSTATPIGKMGPLLENIPAARLFEEVLKLFMGGYGVAVLKGLREYDLLQYLLPATDQALKQQLPYAEALFEQAAHNTDDRIQRDLRVTPAFIFAALLWPSVQSETRKLLDEGMPPVQASAEAAQNVISQQLQRTSIPKRFTQGMKEIWDLQHRLTRRQGKRAERIFEHPRFRAAYDFVLLREQAGEDLEGLGDWWTRYQDVDADERTRMSEKISGPGGGANRRRRRRRKPSGGNRGGNGSSSHNNSSQS
ncbi:polynucleotide adenylyltransferase PcnB [Pseudomaricurvus alkylphenolicus]|jgi:poly(A) polymerase|uniref:polynucleotide adenylyltransferase PcnB n=1 Tax=Pseudomaricurvus alkylphenolicus TaxID=1306991 RepID=UPI001420C52A|nr:polynucleotide adenylyltransferase PcnB [Pseudomaricurvus alkylphenolicus]NIB42899.1 polynucleotide adenylyltransferase PcnB [Pseudomaricurvus alkylphenolicus]